MPHFTAARPAGRAKPLSLDSLGLAVSLIALLLKILRILPLKFRLFGASPVHPAQTFIALL